MLDVGPNGLLLVACWWSLAVRRNPTTPSRPVKYHLNNNEWISREIWSAILKCVIWSIINETSKTYLSWVVNTVAADDVWASAGAVMTKFGPRIYETVTRKLTHWGRGKIAAVSQTSFSNVFLPWKAWISIEVSQKFIPNGSINNKRALVQILAWRRTGDKPLSEPMVG